MATSTSGIRSETAPGAQPMMEREVVLIRVFDAPRELVFDAWTKPEHLRRWWGPTIFTNPVCEADLRVGGAWRIVMRAPDGKDYPCEGVYREIVRPEKLVFTNIATDTEGNHLLEGLTTVLFENEDGKTKLTLRTFASGLVPYAPQMLAGMEMGWSQSLDKLTENLAERTAEGGKTRLTNRMLFASREQRDLVAKTYRAVEGGNQTMGRLAQHLTTL